MRSLEKKAAGLTAKNKRSFSSQIISSTTYEHQDWKSRFLDIKCLQDKKHYLSELKEFIQENNPKYWEEDWKEFQRKNLTANIWIKKIKKWEDRFNKNEFTPAKGLNKRKKNWDQDQDQQHPESRQKKHLAVVEQEKENSFFDLLVVKKKQKNIQEETEESLGAKKNKEKENEEEEGEEEEEEEEEEEGNHFLLPSHFGGDGMG